MNCSREEFFAERQLVVAFHVFQFAFHVEDHAWRAEVVRDQPAHLRVAARSTRLNALTGVGLQAAVSIGRAAPKHIPRTVLVDDRTLRRVGGPL